MPNSCAITPMSRVDLPQIAAIDRLQHPVSWQEQSFAAALDQGWCCRVLKSAQAQVLGYTVMRPVVDEAELLNITVHPEYCHRGLGQELLQDMLTCARAQGVRQVFLEVREQNCAAIRLYVKTGFTITGMRKNYYPVTSAENPRAIVGREHAVLMQRLLGDAVDG